MNLVKEMSKRQERLLQDGHEAGLRCQPGKQPREAVEGDIAAWQRGYESGKAVRLQAIKKAQAHAGKAQRLQAIRDALARASSDQRGI